MNETATTVICQGFKPWLGPQTEDYQNRVLSKCAFNFEENPQQSAAILGALGIGGGAALSGLLAKKDKARKAAFRGLLGALLGGGAGYMLGGGLGQRDQPKSRNPILGRGGNVDITMGDTDTEGYLKNNPLAKIMREGAAEKAFEDQISAEETAKFLEESGATDPTLLERQPVAPTMQDAVSLAPAPRNPLLGILSDYQKPAITMREGAAEKAFEDQISAEETAKLLEESGATDPTLLERQPVAPTMQDAVSLAPAPRNPLLGILSGY